MRRIISFQKQLLEESQFKNNLPSTLIQLYHNLESYELHEVDEDEGKGAFPKIYLQYLTFDF